jgi:hypothetical protein
MLPDSEDTGAGAPAPAIVDVLTAVAAHGIAAPDRPPVPEPLEQRAWQHLRRSVNSERLEGLLVQAIEDGAVAVTAGQWQEAIDDHREAMSAAVMLEHRLLGVLDRFAATGIEARVLKGPSFAHLSYPMPELRPFGDLDLLVRPADFDAARRLMEEAGAHRRYSEPRPGFDRRFSKGACLVMPAYEVDLHRTLALGPFGLLIDLDELFAGVEYFDLGGRDVPALDLPRRFVHACMHTILGQSEPRLIGLRDLAQMALGGELDTDEVARLCSSWQCEVVGAEAVRASWSRLEPSARPELLSWADHFVPTSTDTRRLAVYRGTSRSGARLDLESARALDRLGDKAAYLAAVLFPSGNRAGWLKRWSRAIDSFRPRLHRRPA